MPGFTCYDDEHFLKSSGKETIFNFLKTVYFQNKISRHCEEVTDEE